MTFEYAFNRCIACAYLCYKGSEDITENVRHIISNLMSFDDPAIIDTIAESFKGLICYKGLINRNFRHMSYAEIHRVITDFRFTCEGWQRHHNGQSPQSALKLEQDSKH